MIPTLLLVGLVLGKWWRVVIPAGAIGWAVLPIVTASILAFHSPPRLRCWEPSMSLLVLSCFKPRACCSAASSGLRGPQKSTRPGGSGPFQVSLVVLQSAYDMAVVRDGCPSRGRLHRAS